MKRIERAAEILGRFPSKSTAHMSPEERVNGIAQMLRDLGVMAHQDGCIAAAWAYEFLTGSGADELRHRPVAFMTRDEFSKLPDYSRSDPTLLPVGKIWKTQTAQGWFRAEVLGHVPAEPPAREGAVNAVLRWQYIVLQERKIHPTKDEDIPDGPRKAAIKKTALKKKASRK